MVIISYYIYFSAITRIWFGQDAEMKDATMAMLNGDVHPTFLYLTPESFFSDVYHSMLLDLHQRGHIARIVVDEVQVILEVSAQYLKWHFLTNNP